MKLEQKEGLHSLIEYARAVAVSEDHWQRSRGQKLTLMLWLGDQLANHGLDDANVSVQQPAEGAAKQCHPDVLGETDHHHTEHRADTSEQQHWLSPDAVRQAAPVHAHQGLREGEGRDEQAGVERGVIFVADLEALDKGPGIGEDGGERDGLGEADDGWGGLVWLGATVRERRLT